MASPPGPPKPPNDPPPPAPLPSSVIFQGAKEIVISHDGETYRLRITKNNRLILTK